MNREKPGLGGEAAKLIIEHARDYAILLLGLDGRILSWSPGAERITGYAAHEAIDADFETLFTPSDLAAGQDRAELQRAWEQGRAEDSRWHMRRDGTRFWANGVTMAVRDGETPMLIKIIRDETQIKLADEQRTLLLNELNHRINNTLVTVQSLVEQTLRAADLDRSVRDDLTARLQALSQAHGALMEQNWAGAELFDLVARTLAPFDAGAASRIAAEGPPLRLSPQQAVSFSLVLHELATNAVKHGALSNGHGRVALHWNNAVDEHGQRRMTFLWKESGGPLVVPPTRRGFGSRLFERSFPDPTAGGARVEFEPEGVRCVISLKLSSDAETPMLDLVAAARGT